MVTGRASPGTGGEDTRTWHRADHAARSAALARAG
jgi:hypothetical protein